MPNLHPNEDEFHCDAILLQAFMETVRIRTGRTVLIGDDIQRYDEIRFTARGVSMDSVEMPPRLPIHRPNPNPKQVAAEKYEKERLGRVTIDTSLAPVAGVDLDKMQRDLAKVGQNENGA